MVGRMISPDVDPEDVLIISVLRGVPDDIPSRVFLIETTVTDRYSTSTTKYSVVPAGFEAVNLKPIDS